MEQYYKDNGLFDTDFTLPEYLQLKFDRILNELSSAQQNNHYVKTAQNIIYEESIVYTNVQNSGGINQVRGPYSYFIWIDWGIFFRVWLDSENVGKLGLGNAAAVLVAAFGPIGIVIAAIIVGSIWYIQDADQGNGVRFDARISGNPLLPRFYVANAVSQ